MTLENHKHFLNLPEREIKPRRKGLTALIDSGYSINYFSDVINSNQTLIDSVKFGWGTSIVTEKIEDKINCLNELKIPFFFGGSLFEKAFSQNKTEEFYSFVKASSASHVEISDGTVVIDLSERAKLISKYAKDFTVYTEVGYKDQTRSLELHPAKWIELIKKDIDSGADKVILEARESGSSGICRPNGEVRFGLIEEILASDIPKEKLIFEAPSKSLQVYFVKKIGPNVNLGNIAFKDIVSLETLRLGLRADTLDSFNQ